MDAEDDGSEFVAFYEREYLPQVRRALLLTGSEVVAEDVVHQAFTAVWDRWDSIDQPGAYLNRCVINAIRDHQRGQVRDRAVVALSSGEGAVSAEPPEFLSDVLMELPLNQRAVIVLRYFGGLRDVEIAAALDCPEGSVGPWARRALDTLERELR